MQPTPSRDERIALADQLRARKVAVANAVTDEFFRRHPDWLSRFGERGRQRGIEDAAFHIDFLIGAIESGSSSAFADYVHWAAGVLRARGIASHFLAENLEQIERALGSYLDDRDRTRLHEVLAAGIDACTSGTTAAGTPPERRNTPLALIRGVFLQALLQGERRAATNIALEALRDGHTLIDLYCTVFQEALYETGRLWETNQISVAQEHMATATAQYVLAQIYPHIERGQHLRGRVVVTGVQGELHQLGANMVADMLEADGWDVRFLGTNMPHEGIVRVVEEHQADVLGISATMLFNMPQVRHLITQVRQHSGSARPRIVVGGSAFHAAPTLWQELAADGYASSLPQAVALVRQWSAPELSGTNQGSTEAAIRLELESLGSEEP